MQNLNLSKQKFLLKIQKLNLKMLKLKKPRKDLRKFSWIDGQKKPWSVKAMDLALTVTAMVEKKLADIEPNTDWIYVPMFPVLSRILLWWCN